jgi:hypothetical protein
MTLKIPSSCSTANVHAKCRKFISIMIKDRSVELSGLEDSAVQRTIDVWWQRCVWLLDRVTGRSRCADVHLHHITQLLATHLLDLLCVFDLLHHQVLLGVLFALLLALLLLATLLLHHPPTICNQK